MNRPSAPTNLTLAWVGPAEKKPQDRAAEKSDLIDFLGLRILSRRFQESAASAERPFNPSTVSDRADKAWKKAKLNRITLHEARHTFASLMIAARGPIPVAHCRRRS